VINRKMEKKNEKENETANTGEKVVRRQEGDQRGYFKELFNFACVLRGEVKYLEPGEDQGVYCTGVRG